MNKIKEFFSKKSLGTYFLLAGAIISVIYAIVYGVSRENAGSWMLLFPILAAVLAIALSFFRIRYLEYIPFVLSIVSLSLAVFVLLDNLADIFAKNNVLGLSGAFIFALVLAIIGTLCFALSTIFKLDKEEK